MWCLELRDKTLQRRHRWFIKAGTCNARREEGQKQDMERRRKEGKRDKMKIVPLTAKWTAKRRRDSLSTVMRYD